MVTIFVFVKGQTKEGLSFAVKNKLNGAVVPLTDATIVLVAFQPKSATKLFQESVSIDDAENGLCSWVPSAASILGEVGTFKCELNITFSDETIGKIQEFYIKIVEEAPVS